MEPLPFKCLNQNLSVHDRWLYCAIVLLCIDMLYAIGDIYSFALALQVKFLEGFFTLSISGNTALS